MADTGGELRLPLVSEINGTSKAVPADAKFLRGAPQQQDTKQSESAAPQVSTAAAPWHTAPYWTRHRSTTDLNSIIIWACCKAHNCCVIISS